MTSTANRREFERQRKEVRVRYSLLGSEEYSDARLVDVSEGGLCMETSTPLRTGTQIYVQLLNINPEISGLAAHRTSHGRVRWTRDLGCLEQTRFGIGVQYTHPVCH
ncbi:Tfp pilus assembly protein PilZ [Desulfomicrobium macestii]|uniref:PilZ domain-containing protein n=2 Tax=Desulfomicrobium TaxID=898 RepID=A0A8G2C5J3_DESNO|nr:MULTISPECIES: PilZ domain-containing protein [Desulfomicrobium]MBE1426017.1 Tfp pilus assembly protein PilZ [Desulfomicrobium macestii]SFM12236.1 PilZ domain-containing protein [Desulfomicrobium norvegicum]